MESLAKPLLKKRFARIVVSYDPDQEVYPNMPDDVEGMLQPVLIGSIPTNGTVTTMRRFLTAAPLVPVDIGADMGSGVFRGRKFKIVADIKNPETGNTHGLGSTLRVFKNSGGVVSEIVNGTPAGTVYYSLSDNNTQIDFANTVSGDLKSDDIIRASTLFYTDDAAGTFTGIANGNILYIPDVIHFLLICFTTLTTADLELSTFTRNGVSKQGIIGTHTNPDWVSSFTFPIIQGFFDNQINIDEIADILAFMCDCRLTWNTSGKLELRRYINQLSDQNAFVTDADINDFTEETRLDSIVNRVVINFAQVPAGAQNMSFISNPKKPKHMKRKKYKPINITLETQAFNIVKNSLIKNINGINVVDDFGKALKLENDREIITYFQDQTTAQDLADELYRRWGRIWWKINLLAINGSLLDVIPGDVFAVHRSRSAHGDISDGKLFRLMDATRFQANKTTRVERADEVK